MPYELRYVEHHKIDFDRWDDCIRSAYNSRPYALSAVLRAAAGKQWDAIILNDYEAVMPLPYNRKLLIYKQLYQPFLLQQLGIFSVKTLTQNDILAFLTAAKTRFKYIYLQLNSGNHIEKNQVGEGLAEATIEPRKNQTLRLNHPYIELHKNYNNGLRARLRKAEKLGFEVHNKVQFDEWLYIFKTYQLPRIKGLPLNIFSKIKQIIDFIPEKTQFWGVNNAENTLLAAILVLYSPQRITILLNCSTDEGRKHAATHFLIDSLIKKYAETDTVLDFEGSSIPNIAEFNASFGAEDDAYFIFKSNTLPYFFRLFKP